MTWTAAKECAEVSHDVARERAPQPGVPLRRPGDSDADYAALLAWYEYLEDEAACIDDPDPTYAETIGLDDFDVRGDR